MQKGLHSRPLLVQLPIYEESGNDTTFTGLIDLLRLEALSFRGPGGEHVKREPLTASHPLHSESLRARKALIESLAAVDETLLESVLDGDALENDQNDTSLVSEAELREALRRQTIEGTVVSVFCGSAARNIGIQSLLDGISDFLPSPRERPAITASVAQAADSNKGKKGGKGQRVAGADEVLPVERISQDVRLEDNLLSVLAFKVVWNPLIGAQTFVRVYSGTLSRTSQLFNTNLQRCERVNKLFLAYADQYIEVQQLRAGQIGVVVGFQDTKTGDTLVDEKQAAQQKAFPLRSLQLPSITIPPPVFTMSIEPHGKNDEAPLREALNMLVRTDPSLRLNDRSVADEETGSGQSTLSGMGELHLDIAKGRLRDEFSVRASLGDVRVSFREALAPDQRMEVQEDLDRMFGGKRLQAGCTIVIEPLDESAEGLTPNELEIVLESTGEASMEGEDSIIKEQALRNGLLAGLARGPLSGSPIVGLRVKLQGLQTFGPENSPPAALTAVASKALRTALRKAQVMMLEPFMNLQIQCDEVHLGKVVSNLTNDHQGEIVQIVQGDSPDVQQAVAAIDDKTYLPPEFGLGQSLSDGDHSRQKTVIHAKAPLSSLAAYSTRLRAITAGSGTFRMSFSSFQGVQQARKEAILRELGRM